MQAALVLRQPPSLGVVPMAFARICSWPVVHRGRMPVSVCDAGAEFDEQDCLAGCNDGIAILYRLYRDRNFIVSRVDRP